MRFTRYTHRLRQGFEQGRRLGLRHAPRTPLARVNAWLMVALFLVSTLVAAIQPLIPAKAYALDDTARSVLPEPTPEFSKLLKYDATQAAYTFNAGYTPDASDMSLSSSGPRITAKFYTDANGKGVTVTDPVKNLDFNLKPGFAVGSPQKQDNQLMYPLAGNAGFLVYTGQVDSVKEDILLARYSSDRVSYDYDMDLPDGTQAKVETNGSLGIYGAQLPIYGQVATGSDQDAALLQKAQQNAKKTVLLANIPAPVVVEVHKKVSQVRAHYELDGSQVRIVADHLKGASFPLAIDPSIYIETAQKLMRGNNETNIDFNTTNELIQKGELTGGRFDNWLSTTNLPVNLQGMGTAVGGGYIYVAGGMTSNTRKQSVYWAQFNTTTDTIDAPTPGTSTACSGWCTSSVYNLPVALSNFSMVYYSGFLYVIGGDTNSGFSNAVYIAKLGANGEPSLWHPSDPNPANWVYWYTDSSFNLSSARSQLSAAAYNNRLYIVGGKTAASGTGSGGITNVEVANINPMGTLGSWSTTGMVALTSVRRGQNIQLYNDRMYVIGGISSTTVQSSVQYIKLNSDGTMAGSWTTAISMLNPRFSEGGTFSTIWGGYLYVAGGCSSATGTGSWCASAGQSTDRDIELASINADGSVTNWTAITGLQATRTNYGLVSWRKTIYAVGGCTAWSDVAGNCTTDTNVDQYGAINSQGDVSTTNNSVASGTAPCSGATPTNCNIPPAGASAGQIGNMVDGVALNNGYIYLIGGCTVVSVGSNCFNHNTGAMSDNIAYAALAVDGSVVAPTCTGTGLTLVGTWCVDSTHTINASTGVGAEATTVFNNVLYVIGGTDGGSWSANIYRTNLNNDGSIAASWTAQTFSNVGLGTARGFAYAYSRANPSAAATDPGVMFVLGGCNNGLKSNGIPCATYFNGVYKCFITTTGAIDTTNQCTTTGQLQLDSENDGTGQGLAGFAATVYAGYMYLIGGTSPNQPVRGTVLYAQIDNNNNIVAAPGGAGKWITSPNQITPVRQRGAAFGYNGFLYSLAGYNTSGSLNDVLYAKINVNDGSIGSFTTSHVTVTPRWGLMAVVANGFVYAMGGCGAGAAPTDCTSMTQTVQTFQLYNNYSGTPAGYNATSSTGVDRIGGSATVLNGYIYYAAGCSDLACTAPQSTVYYAVLNADGTIGTWSTSPNALPAARTWGKLVAQGGYLYYLGGQDASGTAQTTVYYSQPSSGVPGTWGTATNGLPAALTEVGAAVWNNRLYVAGGSTAGTRQTTVYDSPSIPSGGDIGSAWSSTTGFNIARSGATAVAYADNLYVIGGYTGANYLADVQYAKIASDGTVGSWSYTTSLPQYTYEADGFAANGYMYLFGGRSATSTCSNSAFVSAISANTTIASGNNPTGAGDWSQTNVKFNAARYGAAVAYGDGRAYVLGGGCSAFVASGDRSYATALQAQPAVAKYSRMIDADTDVFPTKWLMNGLDNDIGARWQLKYSSMSNPLITDPSKMCASSVMSTWGQTVNYGTVTLGTPDNYIAKDGSGTTIPCARYYFLNVSIDSSKAFGYPDDVTRGPTVDDITLFFTADPSKRLRHGKTFTGGQLQPLDTPF